MCCKLALKLRLKLLFNNAIRYDTRCYFNVLSKADTETTTKNCKTEKLKSKNSLC